MSSPVKHMQYKQKAKRFFSVLLPIFVTQVALTATGFFDTVMSGHVSEQDLAGVAVGSNLFMPFFGSFLGIISVLTPTIAQLHGAGKQERIGFVVRQGFYWSLGLAGVFLLLGIFFVPTILEFLALEPKVERVAAGYLAAIAFGIVPIFLAGVLRNLIDAHGYTRLTMVITLVTVPINVLANYIFMYGTLGIPAFGGIGAGIGSAIAFSLNFLLNVIVVVTVEPFRSYHIFHSLPRPDLSEWKRSLSLGIPIGSTMFCEQSIFSAVGLFMTVYGTTVVAAHQAAMNFTTLVYMIPLSASMTLTILVGFEIGAGRSEEAAAYIRLGRLLTFVFEGSLAILLVQFRETIAALYTSSSDVQELLVVFLVFAVFLQLADSIDSPLQGALRGYKDVHVTFLLAVISYWVIGLPAGWLIANYTSVGPYGYWCGLIIGIAFGAIFLSLRLRTVQKRYRMREQGA